VKVSIIIPVYNEEKTVKTLLKKVLNIRLSGIEKEIIVVDDGSTDTSVLLISQMQLSHFQLIKHTKNQGKGAAVRTGIKKATGDYIVIQDADLEYDPRQIIALFDPIKTGEAKIVYGTRLKRLPNLRRDEHHPRFLLHYVGNKLLSLLTSMLYFQWITDMETCYKVFPKKVIDNIPLHAKGFEFEPEITAKFLKRGHKIYEVPIQTMPRGYAEGKKLNTFHDGRRAFWTLIKYRFYE
jgi:dolichol-phosphate mannosyltransferase